MQRVLVACKGTYPTFGDAVEHCPFFWKAPDWECAETQATMARVATPTGVAACCLLLGRLAILKPDAFGQDRVVRVLQRVASDMGLPTKQCLKQLRVALTGQSQGPGLGAVIETLGQRTALKRLSAFTIYHDTSSAKTKR